MNINTINENPHHYNLGKIDDALWKHKITINTNLQLNQVNLFGANKLCGCFAKIILKHQKQYDNYPMGFILSEFTKSGDLQFLSTWTQLKEIDGLNKIFEGDNDQHTFCSGDKIVNRLGYSVIDKQISNYVSKHNDDWIMYITKRPNMFVYYTPSLVTSIEGIDKGIRKINKQTGLIDERNIHLIKYLSEERRVRHNNILSTPRK